MPIIDTSNPNGLKTSADNERFVILPDVVVSTDSSGFQSFAFDVQNNNVSLLNRGSLVAVQSSALAAQQGTVGGLFINDAGASISGELGAGMLGGSQTFKNVGSVFGYLDMGVWAAGNNALVDNRGYIFGVTAGVTFEGQAHKLVNHGVIESLGDGLDIDSADTTEVTNAGTIDGGVRAIHLGVGAGALSLVNTGELRGGIEADAAGGDDAVANGGMIVGEVLLGPGDDVFDGAGGTSGGVFGEAGDDRLAGGSADDLLFGGDGADLVKGGGGDDELAGGSGEDILKGGKGRDWLDGGEGSDRLIGGGGDDRFVFEAGLASVDKIVRFKADRDEIVLDDDLFAALGASGSLSAAAFVVGAAAADGSDRIVYDDATGALSYDADGEGGVGQVKFAKLKGAPDISADDFLVVA